MTMRPVYAKFEERHHAILKQRARDEGCTLSDLVRRATISVFSLPTTGEEIADTGDGVASGVTGSYDDTPQPSDTQGSSGVPPSAATVRGGAADVGASDG